MLQLLRLQQRQPLPTARLRSYVPHPQPNTAALSCLKSCTRLTHKHLLQLLQMDMAKLLLRHQHSSRSTYHRALLMTSSISNFQLQYQLYSTSLFALRLL